MATRKEFSDKTKADAFERAGRCCEECGVYLRDGAKKQFDHIKTAYHGGDNSLENCQVLCCPCHDKKTCDMNSNRSAVSIPKSRRLIKKGAGLRGRKLRGPPLPGTKASGLKQGMDGSWYKR